MLFALSRGYVSALIVTTVEDRIQKNMYALSFSNTLKPKFLELFLFASKTNFY